MAINKLIMKQIMETRMMDSIKKNIMKAILAIPCFFIVSVFILLISDSGSCIFASDSTEQNRENYVPVETVKASIETVEETYTAVGTVKPRSETMIEAQINAQVERVHVQPGDRVKKGDLLITLDDRQAISRRDGATAALNAARAGREQALQGVKAAEAAYKEAKLQYNRIQGYYKAQAATKQELEMAESGYAQSMAAMRRAKDGLDASEAGIKQAMGALSETHVGLEFSSITAPATGEIIKRMVEPGDLALPGKPLISLRTESGFRIEAYVREGLIGKLKTGMILKAEITTLGITCNVEVEEIIPYADPETRTFLVKAVLPKAQESRKNQNQTQTELAGIYPGMYGKLLIPESTEEVVLLPAKAVIMTGQLELVMIQTDKEWQLRYIKTGKRIGDMVEVLSGLKGDETIGVGGLN
ncbi:MAG: efflux RND transporter periplasmic adaptor subunit [Desulfamplus sp.]|nr:efflux RND transporter periplasmic adaptor subunit [Desulfamplus sp.]